MTTQQKRERNWQKARLMGFNLNFHSLGIAEQELYQEMVNIKDSLLSTWDYNTEILIGHPLPPYKCHWCGKRSNVSHQFRDNNYCYKHYKEHYEER